MRESKIAGANFDALPLEYKRKNRAAHRNLDVNDLINNPAANGVCSVLGLRFPEERPDLFLAKLGSLLDNRADSILIAEDTVQSFTDGFFL